METRISADAEETPAAQDRAGREDAVRALQAPLNLDHPRLDGLKGREGRKSSRRHDGRDAEPRAEGCSLSRDAVFPGDQAVSEQWPGLRHAAVDG